MHACISLLIVSLNFCLGLFKLGTQFPWDIFLHMIAGPIGFEPERKDFRSLVIKVLKMIKNRRKLFGLVETLSEPLDG